MKNTRLLSGLLTIILILALAVVPAAGQVVPEDLQSAAAELREGIKDWENFITVMFEVDPDSFDGTQASAKDIAQQVLDLALAHTGVPDEGDFLRFNIGYMEPNSVNFTKQNEVWQFTVTYYIVYWTTAEQEAELDREIEALVQSLNLKSSLTDYEKISAIYQYITGNITYDNENLSNPAYGLKFTTYAAAVNKTAVCQGYATLFYRLALEAGIDSRIITGIGYTDEGTEDHAWNIVKLDSKYYHLDSTWDAEEYNYYYFLKSQRDFMLHEADAEYLTEEFLSAYPLAQESYQHAVSVETDYEYQVVNGAVVITKYTGTDSHVTVPATLGGYPVHTIASNVFYDNPNILTLTFSEGIQMIDGSAIICCVNLKVIHLPSTVNYTASNVPDFQCRVVCGAWDCPSIETITVAEGNPYLTVQDNVLYNKDMTILRYYPAGDPREYFEIPKGVKSIGAGAFNYSFHLKEIKMPDTVLRIQSSCFQDCSKLEKVNISNNCHFIDQHVFLRTALTSIHIPASVTTLYYGSLGFTTNLKAITVDPTNPVYYVADGVLYGHYTTSNRPHESYMVGEWLIRYPSGSDAASFTVPDGIVGIDQNAFSCSDNLTEIILPNSLRIILAEAFMESRNLQKLVIPSTVHYLGDVLFTSNTKLKQLVFLGDPPAINLEPFPQQKPNMFYPKGNAKWEAIKQKYARYTVIKWSELCETHQFIEKVYEVTCTDDGYSQIECSVCGLVESSGSVIPAFGHSNDGNDICVNCGEKLPCSHNMLSEYVRPTCTQSGHTFYWCTRCGETTTDNEVAPLGHNYVDGICTNCGQDDPQALDRNSNIGLIVVCIEFVLMLATMSLYLIRKRKKQ